MTPHDQVFDGSSRKVYIQDKQYLTSSQNWKILYANEQTKNCDKLYYIVNEGTNEYFHANNSYFQSTNVRRYVFLSNISYADLDSNRDFGHLWIFQKKTGSNYYIYNYLTYEFMYQSGIQENSKRVPVTWMFFDINDWLGNIDLTRTWSLKLIKSL